MVLATESYGFDFGFVFCSLRLGKQLHVRDSNVHCPWVGSARAPLESSDLPDLSLLGT